MARDDKDATRQDFEFVDRDDDRGGDERVDADYDENFPPLGTDESEPDPGYAAFAGELEDPLADWPSPDASLDDLPEMRRRDDSSAVGNPVSEEQDDWLPEDEDDATAAGGGGAFDDPGDGSGAWDLSDDDGPAAGSEQSDGDDDFTALSGQPSDPRDAKAPGPDTPVTADARDDLDLPDPPAAEPLDGELPAGEPVGAMVEADVNAGEDFVDDFLNDLDEPDDGFDDDLDDAIGLEGGAGSRVAEEDDAPPMGEDAFEPGNAMSAAAAVPAAKRSAVERHDDGAPAPRKAPSGAADGGDRVLPWAMIAVVALALVLLAAGGYGVVQQRSGLKEQIRDLQAQLATAVSPEEAEAAREQQRQMTVENESLAAELEALAAENAALEEQIAGLQAQLGEREAAEAEALAKAERAAAREAERAAAQRAAAERRAAPAAEDAGGPWFVNFGSYAQRDVAERWAGRISAGDGKVVVQTATAAGKTLYRVRVVGLGSQDSAERVATALERQYQLPRLWVGRSDQ